MEAIYDVMNQHGRKLATATSIVAVVLMSLSVAHAVLFVIEHADDSTAAPVSRSTPANSEPSVSTVNLAALNLFGTVEDTAPRVIDAPQTNLNLELQGVFTADDPDESTAIVAERNKTGELFSIGERLPGNAILDSVFDDHILIRRGGRLEKLMFSDASVRQGFSSNQTNRTSSSTSLPSNTQSRLQDLRERIAARRAQTTNPPTPTVRSGNLREQITEYRQRLEEDPDAALREIGFDPVSDSEAGGYRVAGDIPEQYLNQAGLQKGDVVLSVNGTPVGDIRNDRRLIDQALSSGRARVEIQRGDRKFFLTVPIPEGN